MLAESRRSVCVERVMGTVLSRDLRGTGDHGAAIAEAVAWFHEADRRFSPYRTDSETCRHGLGEIPEEDRSPELADIIRVCDSIGALSGGAFDAWRAGVFDPSAYVKGWSAERAAAILRRYGCTDWSINAGGDVLTSGAPLPGRPWRVGVQHPFERGALAAVVSGTDLAVATSGTYERGGHIVHPATGEACDAAVSVTVVGRDLGHADACSTAAFALGVDGPRWIAAIPHCESMTVWADGRVTATGGFPTTVHGVSITTVRQTDLVGAA